jgi:hypothetical protein
MTSFLFAFYACWILLSPEGKARIATKEWIPTFIAIGAIALMMLHVALNYLSILTPISW